MEAMKIDEVSEYLKCQGLRDNNIDDVIAHFGVLGQKWGVRNASKQMEKKLVNATPVLVTQAKKNRRERRLGTAATYVTGVQIMPHVLRALGAKNPRVVAATTVAISATGAVAVNRMLRDRGDKKLSEIKGEL